MTDATIGDGRRDPSCPACGRPNPRSFQFCGGCGRPLTSICSSCGALSPPGFEFCGQCGAPFAGTASVVDRRAVDARAAPNDATDIGPDAERGLGEQRKVITVLYADVVASTDLASRLDPEELHGILAPFFASMSDEVERFGGSVEKYIGDAIVAVFGHPVAHGDDAERAVRAALGMQARLARDRPAHGDPAYRLAIRVGVNTGDVITRPWTDRGGAITGDAISLASRLQAVAPVGSVVVSERTKRAALGVAYRFLGDETLKGFDRPIAVWEAVARERPAGDETGLRTSTVGRADELALLRALFERTRRAQTANRVTIVGPPGIGKSRLARDFLDSAGEVRVVEGRCLPYSDGVASWPLAEILKADLEILDSDPPGSTVGRAAERLTPRFGASAGAAETTQMLLSSIGIDPGSDPLAGLEPGAARRAISAAWRRYFESLCRDGALIAVIEDIHWAEPALLDLLDSVAATVVGPFFLVCLARPELWDRRPGWGGGFGNATTLALSPLSSSEAAELIAGLLGEHVPPEIIEPVVERSGGNPFFVCELIRMMVDDGTLDRSGDGWRRARPLPTALPDTVQGVIASRIDLLSPTAKRALQDAAVVGRVFWAGALARLSSVEAVAATEELVEKGLVREHEVSGIGSERELGFQHILIRDVAYAGIPHARLAGAHATVLEWLQEKTVGREEDLAEILSHHASLAGDVEATARFAMLAGHRHRRVFAAEEAIRWYDRANGALDRLDSDRAAGMLIETLFARGESSEQLGRLVEAAADYERALAVAGTRPSGSREWLESRALASLVQVLWTAGRFDEAERLLPRALEAAADQNADDLTARLSSGAGSVALRRGDPIRARRLQERALAVAAAAEDRESEALARHGLAEAASIVGPFSSGLDQGRRADELLRRIGHRPLVHRNERLMALLLWLSGERDAAIDMAAKAVDGSRDAGSRGDLVAALATLGWGSLSAGQIEPALGYLDEAAAMAAEIRTPSSIVATCAWRASVLAELGAVDRVAAEVAASLEAAEEVGDGLHRGPLLAARGWLEAAEGDLARAEATFEAAAAAAAGTRLPAMLAARIELLAGAMTGSARVIACATDRMATAAGEDCPPFRAWAAFGAASAAMRRGEPDAAERGARLALEDATTAGEEPLVWRSGLLLGDALDALARRPEADSARRAARRRFRAMCEGIDDDGLRAAYATRSGSPSLLGTPSPPVTRR